MKHHKSIMTALSLLLTMSGSAWAQQVRQGTVTGATITFATAQDGDYSSTIASGLTAGTSTVYMKVAVADGNYIEAGDITLTQTKESSEAQAPGMRLAPGVAEPVSFSLVSGTATDLTAEHIYSFTMPAGGANVTVDATATARTAITAEMITDIAAQTYTGSAIEPVLTVSTLTLGTDYTVSYSNNTAAGTATATVTGINRYTGTPTKNFTIAQKPVSASTITGLVANNKEYDGTTDVTFDYSGISIYGKVNGDDLSVTATGNFLYSFVGNNQTVNYTLALTGSSAANYKFSKSGNSTNNTGQTLANITQRVVTLNWTNTEFTYDGDAHKPTATVTNLVGSEKCTVTVSGEQTNAGDDYTATASALAGSNAANYTLEGATATTQDFTIAKATSTVTTAPTLANNAAYDAEGVSLLATDGAASFGTILYACSTDAETPGEFSATAPKANAVGTWYVWYKVDGTDNFNGVAQTKIDGSVVISAATFTPAVTLADWTYGSPNTPTLGDSNISDGAVTYSYKTGDADWTTTQPTAVGSHKVKATVAANGNYAESTSAEVEFAIAARTATLEWANTSLTYNGTAQKPTATVSNLVSGDECTVTVSGEQTTAGNEYTATATALSNSNYALPETKTQAFAIAKATLTATADDKERAFGEANPELTVSVTGFVNGETAATAAGYEAPTAATEANAESAAGTYEITVSGGAATNYTFTYVNGTLTIGNATIAYTADNYSGTYDGAAHGIALDVTTPETTVKYRTTESGEYNLDAAPTFTNATAAQTVYFQITKDNYTTVEGSKTVAINKKNLTVTAEAKVMNIGDAVPALTYQSSGLVGDDEISGTLACDADADVAGNYDITVGTLTAGDNYNISFTGATLTVRGMVNYTVKHLHQNTTGDDYTEVSSDEETKQGKVGELTAATAKSYTGFTAQPITQATIAEDGSTLIEVTYNRNNYTISFNSDGGSAVSDITARYGATVAAPESPTKENYVFVGWYDGTDKYTFDTMPVDGKSLTAHWTASTITPDDSEIDEGEATPTYEIADAENAKVKEVSTNENTTTIAIAGTVGNDNIPVTSIADDAFSGISDEQKQGITSIDLSATQVTGVVVDRSDENNAFYGFPETTIIYLPDGSGNLAATGEKNVVIDGFCDNFQMDDQKSYSIPTEFTACSATLNRSFTSGETSTVCLPYSVPKANLGGKIYYFSAVEGTTVKMKEADGDLQANTPYIFVPSTSQSAITATGSITVNMSNAPQTTQAGQTFTFKGVYSDKTFTAEEISSGIYGFAAEAAHGASSVGQFVKGSMGAYIKGMRAYLAYSGESLTGSDEAAAPDLNMSDALPNVLNVVLEDLNGNVTVIGQLTLANGEDGKAYNLGGMLTGKSHKGITIVDRKKVIKK